VLRQRMSLGGGVAVYVVGRDNQALTPNGAAPEPYWSGAASSFLRRQTPLAASPRQGDSYGSCTQHC
jgi:hypothetical protein